tara:strand:- start:48 stop:599 length:552 start_codon:yes stop_codon:yes gene_type:complete
MTIIKHKNQRVGVFIDTQNLYHSAKHLHNKRVNFKNVLVSAVAGRQLVRAIAYVVNTDTTEEQSFFDALEKSGIETRSKDLQVFAGGAKKGDWDVGLAIDAVTMAEHLDSIVIASGDGDFIPLVRYLKSRGCQVEVISFASSSSSKLMEEVDEFIDMSEDLGNFLLNGSGGKKRSYARRKKKQ